MMTADPRGRLLTALYCCSENNENVDLFSLSEAAGLNLYMTLATLNELGDAGLVWPGRLRLTLEGLVVATSLVAAERPHHMDMPRARTAADARGPQAERGVVRLPNCAA